MVFSLYRANLYCILMEEEIVKGEDIIAAPEENEPVQASVEDVKVETPAPAEAPAEVAEVAVEAPATTAAIIERLGQLQGDAATPAREELEQLKQAFYRLHNTAMAEAREAFVAAGNDADAFVPDGTRYGFIGAGCEFYPIKDKKNLRLHAFWHTNNDNNFKDQYLTVGLKWLLTAFERK